MLISEEKWDYICMRLGLKIAKQVMDAVDISNAISYKFDIY